MDAEQIEYEQELLDAVVASKKILMESDLGRLRLSRRSFTPYFPTNLTQQTDRLIFSLRLAYVCSKDV